MRAVMAAPAVRAQDITSETYLTSASSAFLPPRKAELTVRVRPPTIVPTTIALPGCGGSAPQGNAGVRFQFSWPLKFRKFSTVFLEPHEFYMR